MFIRSERLFLRPIWPEDWQALHAGIADEQVVRNLALAPWPYTEADARAFAALPENPRFPRSAIVAPHGADGERVIGCVGLHEPERIAEGEAILGYWIAQPHWGHGYATEAGRSMLTLARMLGHRRIVANHFLDNPASGKVLERLGFRATGDVELQHSAARGEKALAMRHVLELDVPDGDSDDEGGMGRGGTGRGGTGPGTSGHRRPAALAA
ncbi:MAG TPA: GNAT family N-acetyltransferase [Novosphingobium sp.]|nr:GNAT family N-acetyltransferase [Novosphingobium sp.]